MVSGKAVDYYFCSLLISGEKQKIVISGETLHWKDAVNSKKPQQRDSGSGKYILFLLIPFTRGLKRKKDKNEDIFRHTLEKDAFFSP